MSTQKSQIFHSDHEEFQKNYGLILQMKKPDWEGAIGELVGMNKIKVSSVHIPPTMPRINVEDYNQFLAIWSKRKGRIYWSNDVLQVPIDKNGQRVDPNEQKPDGVIIIESHREYCFADGIWHIFSENRPMTPEEYQQRKEQQEQQMREKLEN